MVPDRLQLQRLELKYIIKEELALEVRNFVQSYLKIDEYSATQKNLSYPVHSLYLDSDNLRIYWGTINGNKNRYKLRLRFYENHPDSPVYFEIKRRLNDAIFKQRGAVRRYSVDYILAGQYPSPEFMVTGEGKHLVAVQRFVDLMLENKAHPKAHVAYFREAYIHPDNNSVRVTLDREVRCCPEPTTRLSTEMNKPVFPFGKNVVLELKFTGRYPLWFRDLVNAFGLTQCSAAKYVDGVTVAGENHFTPAGMPLADAARSMENAETRKMFLEKLQFGEKMRQN